ncbi:hypothetical protein ACJRO7_019331 [Eucalyptus globulus]|uniref:Uncharacterized protein n=1 Tax=Eucalyptus globulus TaxID=34317 RepID=A0ABD3KPQ5_EUCGL
MEAALFRVKSVPNRHSVPSDTSAFSSSSSSSSRIAAGISLRRRRGGGGGSSWRGSAAPRALSQDGAIARRGAPGGARSAGDRGGCAKRSEIGDHYREKLASSPDCSLLLRNYAKYLHEVERDAERAEEYYARAILASPGDGEVLSLYGRLIWEAERDGDRAALYFDRAVNASPDDCMVLGSYARFLWEAGEEDEETV